MFFWWFWCFFGAYGFVGICFPDFVIVYTGVFLGFSMLLMIADVLLCLFHDGFAVSF